MFGWDLQELLVSIPAVLICITFHEFAHGYVAYKLGDHTAALQGRLTLNPVSHIDPIGFFCLLFFRFGWARPVPVNTSRFKNPKWGMAITAFAGPASNFILAFIFIFIVRGTASSGNSVIQAFTQFLLVTALLSIGLGVFNLIPVPPLDGSKIIAPLLPGRMLELFFNYQQAIQLVLVLLLYFGLLSGPVSLLRDIVFRGILTVVNLLYGLIGM